MIIENENLVCDIIKKLKNKKNYMDIIKQFHSKILDKISLIDEYIIYNPEGIMAEDINWNNVKILYDSTGYEASKNEIRLGDYLNIQNTEFVELSYVICDELATYLKKKYPNCIFEIVIQITTNDNILLRFYQKRKGESWIDTYKLDDYKNEKLLVRIC